MICTISDMCPPKRGHDLQVGDHCCRCVASGWMNRECRRKFSTVGENSGKEEVETLRLVAVKCRNYGSVEEGSLRSASD